MSMTLVPDIVKPHGLAILEKSLLFMTSAFLTARFKGRHLICHSRELHLTARTYRKTHGPDTSRERTCTIPPCFFFLCHGENVSMLSMEALFIDMEVQLHGSHYTVFFLLCPLNQARYRLRRIRFAMLCQKQKKSSWSLIPIRM